MSSLIVIIAGSCTGILLGSLGSGGAILTTPVLIYLLGIPPKSAIVMSLAIVALTSIIATISNWTKGSVNLRIALLFGASGLIGSIPGVRVGVIIPVCIQLVVFVLMMCAASWSMFRSQKYKILSLLNANKKRETSSDDRGKYKIPFVVLSTNPRSSIMPLIIMGFLVGFLTGFIGVGGGFLIVPVFVIFAGIEIKEAIRTSLLVIASNSIAGFICYFGEVEVDYGLLLFFAAIAIIGSLVGTEIARRLPSQHLQKIFALFLLAISSYILIRESVL